MQRLINELNVLQTKYDDLEKGEEKEVNEKRQIEIHEELQRENVKYNFSITQGFQLI